MTSVSTTKRPRRTQHSTSSSPDGIVVTNDNVLKKIMRIGHPIVPAMTGMLTVNPREMSTYLSLLDNDPVIFDFLMTDRCLRVSDKYLIAMVFAYFKRAGLSIRAYNRTNFFLGLYLANDMEEDEEDWKYEIFPWYLGSSWRSSYVPFLRKKDKFWQEKLGFRAVVSRRACDQVMSLCPDHPVWSRDRPEYHSGAIRSSQSDIDMYPRGPKSSPRPCHLCEKREDMVLCLSPATTSSEDGYQMKTFHASMEGTLKTCEKLKIEEE